MSTPTYKGSGQPAPTVPQGLGGLLDLFGTTAPVYKTTPAAPPSSCPPAPPSPAPRNAPAPVPMPFPDEPGTETVIPVGPGPITIIIQRS